MKISGDPISQAMVGSFTDPAKHSEIFSVKSAVCKTISCIWTDHAKNPGFSSPTNAGTNEHLKEVGSTKNPRDGLTTVEEDFYAKKQRTTGAFGEASSVPAFGNQESTGTVVKNFSPKLSRVCSV